MADTLRGADIVIRALEQQGVTLHWDGVRLYVTGDRDVTDLVRDALADLQVAVRRLQPRTFTLEEVFLGAGRTGGQAHQIVVDANDPEAVQRAELAARLAAGRNGGVPR